MLKLLTEKRELLLTYPLSVVGMFTQYGNNSHIAISLIYIIKGPYSCGLWMLKQPQSSENVTFIRYTLCLKMLC